MDKDLAELVYVLDRSGSMGPRIEDVIGGFNSLLEQQKKEPGCANVSLIIFDSQIDVIYDGVDIKLVSPLTNRIFFARGSTSLFDAVARATNMVGHRLAATPEDRRPSKVLVTIMTDGYENASTEYNMHQGGAARLKAKIEHQRDKYAWQYVFVGANQDAVLAAADIGIGAGQAMSFSTHSPAAVHNLVRNVSRYASSYRVSSGAEALSCSFTPEERVSSMTGDIQAGDVVSPSVVIQPNVTLDVDAKPDGSPKP